MIDKGVKAVPKLAEPSASSQFKALAMLSAALVLCFARPLYNLLCFALRSELFSYVLLVPMISAYLVFVRRNDLAQGTSPDRKRALFALIAALGISTGYWFYAQSGIVIPEVEYLSWTILIFFLLFVSVCQLCLGRETLKSIAFPIGFLVFMVPFPAWLTSGIESFLQHSSAVAAQWFFELTRMPVVREGLQLALPGIRLEVASECSGIHSTLVLFITSLIAGQIFLRTPWNRAFLCAAVIPIGILRNAFRICVIGHLCVHIGPEMIDSPIHRRGGPIFFVASLVPFLVLLWFLRKSERKTNVLRPQ